MHWQLSNIWKKINQTLKGYHVVVTLSDFVWGGEGWDRKLFLYILGVRKLRERPSYTRTWLHRKLKGSPEQRTAKAMQQRVTIIILEQPMDGQKSTEDFRCEHYQNRWDQGNFHGDKGNFLHMFCIPTSSKTSRTAAWLAVSPISTPPPGTIHLSGKRLLEIKRT